MALITEPCLLWNNSYYIVIKKVFIGILMLISNGAHSTAADGHSTGICSRRALQVCAHTKGGWADYCRNDFQRPLCPKLGIHGPEF